MNSHKRMPEDFDEFWSCVSDEIQVARNRETMRQRLGLVAKATGVFVVIFGLVFAVSLTLKRPDRKEICACEPWQIDGIRPAIGVSAEYPLVCDEKIYALRGKNNDQHILCIEKHTGRILWESKFRVKDCRLIADDSRLFVLASQARGIWTRMALDTESGKELWRHSLREGTISAPSFLAVLGKGICWSQGNRIFLAHPETGKMIWTRQIDDNVKLTTPEEHHGKILVASGDSIYAVNFDNGTVMWSQQYAP
ncbi:MAG: PQQ-binding-like beta-propeller repeat protein, partial [Kiritimatiellae bacterium]|nr:PQQ-binding-like beta-propeller repeat protein [Kiritimatiellia bacterium]